MIGDRVFSYDANGNQTGWESEKNGTRRAIVWDEENRIRTIRDNGHTLAYTYNDAGERVFKTGPQGETVYVNQFYTVRNREAGSKHVFAGIKRVATKLVKGQENVATPASAVNPGKSDPSGKAIGHNKDGGNNGGGSPGNGKVIYEKDIYYYHPDHLGSSTFISDADGELYQHLENFPFGETWVEESTNTQRTPYHFTAKELDEETGLYFFGARYYDPRTSVWQSGDPVLDIYLDGQLGMGGVYTSENISLYAYAHLNPIRYLDPDGKSTWLDRDGNVTNVSIDDQDLGVYQAVPDSNNMCHPPARIGETKYIDEFISPETGKVMTDTNIQVGRSFDPIIEQKSNAAENMNLPEIARASRPGGKFDIKKDYQNVGGLLNGKYATSRSAGNYLAGYNAGKGTIFGVGIKFDTFQKMAGALHGNSEVTKADLAGILLFGTAYGPAPAYGEKMYQMRMSREGWGDATK